MNKKIAKKWAEALRSKKYSKTTGALKVVAEPDHPRAGKCKFSALGVLCELYNQSHKRKLKEVPSDRLDAVRRGWRVVSVEGQWDNGCHRGMWNRPALPEKVSKWAGIKTERCEFMLDHESAKLFRFPIMDLAYSVPFLNDVEAGWDFKKIASLIEIVHERI